MATFTEEQFKQGIPVYRGDSPADGYLNSTKSNLELYNFMSGMTTTQAERLGDGAANAIPEKIPIV